MASKQPDDKIRAWLLHSRPFRETSLLLDCFSLERGRFSAIARGVRNAKSPKRALLQPFVPLSVSVVGKTDLLTLKQVEADGPALMLSGTALFSALYVNELLTRLVHGVEAEPDLFHHYEHTLRALERNDDVEATLRNFELQLLDTLGYGIDFMHDAEHGEPIEAEAHYYLHPDTGLVRQFALEGSSREQQLYGGAELLAIARRDFTEPATRRTAKRLMRQLLARHLGERELASRELFRPL
jgi:DNA repair protein RecO